jgi:hypothetical protein
MAHTNGTLLMGIEHLNMIGIQPIHMRIYTLLVIQLRVMQVILLEVYQIGVLVEEVLVVLENTLLLEEPILVVQLDHLLVVEEEIGQHSEVICREIVNYLLMTLG